MKALTALIRDTDDLELGTDDEAGRLDEFATVVLVGFLSVLTIIALL